MNGCYTEQERIAIEQEAAAYDESCKEEPEQREPRGNHLVELYQAFEQEDLDQLAFLNDEITVMVKLRETFPDDDAIRQWCEYFIRIHNFEIQKIKEEILYDRRQAKIFEKL
jgi:hypothetical protein